MCHLFGNKTTCWQPTAKSLWLHNDSMTARPLTGRPLYVCMRTVTMCAWQLWLWAVEITCSLSAQFPRSISSIAQYSHSVKHCKLLPYSLSVRKTVMQYQPHCILQVSVPVLWNTKMSLLSIVEPSVGELLAASHSDKLEESVSDLIL